MIWFLAMVGCKPSLTFQVTRPAEVVIEQDIQKLAVIDRAGTNDADATATAFVEELLALSNPRFSLSSRVAARSAMGEIAPPDGEVLRPEHTQALCDRLSVSGIVSLEAIDIDDGWASSSYTEERTETVTVNGRAREEVREVEVFVEEFVAEIATTWRLYSCEGRVRDYYQTVVSSAWLGEGDSRSDARLDVGETDDLKGDLAVTAAWVYLKRISPFDVEITRKYYRGVGGSLRTGSVHMAAGNWSAAEQALRSGAKDSGGKKKGKHLYNLAVVSEQQGDLTAAQKQAKRANSLIDSSLSEELVRRLRGRARQEVEIKEQLDEPAPASPPPLPLPNQRVDVDE